MLLPLASADLDFVWTLNQSEVPKVGSLDLARLTKLIEWSDLAVTLQPADEPLGFLIALGAGRPYESANYAWFSEFFAQTPTRTWLYIDRVALAASARRQGWGRRLYADVERWAHSRGYDVIALEVNCDPPNEASLAFHHEVGYRAVGERGHDPAVRMLIKEIA